MTSRHIHYLQLSDVLRVVARVSGFEVAEVATDDVVERARHAIDAPGAERRTAGDERQLYPTLAEKAAVMCERLLLEPPYRERGGRVAFECMNAFLLRNGGVWKERPLHTNLRFDEAVRSPGSARGIRNWVIERIEEGPIARANPNQPSLWVPFGEPPTVVFLSGPLKGLSADKRELLAQLRDEVDAALSEVSTRSGEPCEIRLEHPSTALPIKEGGEGDCRDAWEYTSRLIAEQVDALVIVDIALQSAGFGATSEFDLHVMQDGPTLYVRDASSSVSRFLLGRTAETDLEIADYEQLSEIGPIVVDWACRRWHAIRTASRRRLDRLVQYGPLQKRLHEAWKRASVETRELAADGAGMKVEAVNRILTSTALLSVLPAHRLDSLCRSLGASPRAQGLRQPETETTPDYGALLAAAEEHGWPDSTIVGLLKDSRVDESPPAYFTRSRYKEKSDWVKRRHDLDL